MESMTVSYVFLAIATVFAVMLVLKRWLPFRMCAICISVSLSWISLLILYRVGVIQDAIILALLMGQSSLGVYYLIEKYAPKELTIFRLPFLLSLTLIAYMLISWTVPVWAILFNALVWLLLIGLYAYRRSPKLSAGINSLIDCCSKW